MLKQLSNKLSLSSHTNKRVYQAATNYSFTDELALDHNAGVHAKQIWRSRVSIPLPPACKAGALPCELHPRMYLLMKRACANRESNPALNLGKLQCYRYTIGANVLCLPANIKLKSQGGLEPPTPRSEVWCAIHCATGT